MTGRGRHILIIDDEMAIRHSLLAFLDDRGYQASITASAEEAEMLLRQMHFDAAIVDMRLPGENGAAFIRRIAEAYPDLRFLIYTGSAEFELTDELASVGIRPEHVYRKPVRSLVTIVNAIDAMLESKPATPKI